MCEHTGSVLTLSHGTPSNPLASLHVSFYKKSDTHLRLRDAKKQPQNPLVVNDIAYIHDVYKVICGVALCSVVEHPHPTLETPSHGVAAKQTTVNKIYFSVWRRIGTRGATVGRAFGGVVAWWRNAVVVQRRGAAHRSPWPTPRILRACNRQPTDSGANVGN